MQPAYERASDNFGAGATRRELIVHDSIFFTALTAATLALCGITFLLFRSFQQHRQELAASWSERGRTELQQNKPGDAVVSLQASLSYAPDDYSAQLLLAQALAGAGETEQATSYFLNLWAARPGDGFINLELARLARQARQQSRRSSVADVSEHYRAAIFGDWPQGDGIERRRAARLELSDYLIEQHRFPAARVELLAAAGNAPDTVAFDVLFGDKLLAAEDPQNALIYYKKALADDPRNVAALEHAGRLEYAQGNHAEAHELLARAMGERPDDAELAALDRSAERMENLSLSRELPARERAQHILEAAQIAQARLARCSSGGKVLPVELQALESRWKAASDSTRRSGLAENAAGQDALTGLIFDTEREAEPSCGPATGDDELLLKLAESKGGND